MLKTDFEFLVKSVMFKSFTKLLTLYKIENIMQSKLIRLKHKKDI